MDTVTPSADHMPGLIRRVEALRYRGFRYVAQDVMPFAILVGPNGAGKSTFLDCVALVSDYLDDSLDAALLLSPDEMRGRSRNVDEMIHNQRGSSFEVALDLSVPSGLVHEEKIGDSCYCYDSARYELAICTAKDGATRVLTEALW